MHLKAMTQLNGSIESGHFSQRILHPPRKLRSKIYQSPQCAAVVC
jgi:hypothetical protein